MLLNIFRKHLGLKLISIALATLLWLVVSGEEVAERSLRIPVEFTNFPTQLELIGAPPTVVDVRVRGSAGTVSRIAAGELTAVLDLGSARSGRRIFHIIKDNVRRPFGVEVVQVSPSTVTMTFEISSAKVVPIAPTVDGQPAAGFALGAVTVTPSTVEVVGPVSALSRLTEAITEPVSVEAATAPIDEQVAVGVSDPLLRLRMPLTARVLIAVVPALAEWTVTDVPVQPRNARNESWVLQDQVVVSVRGPRALSDRGADGFDVFVDAAGLAPGQFLLPVRVVPPAGVTVTAVKPEQVRVRIR